MYFFCFFSPGPMEEEMFSGPLLAAKWRLDSDFSLLNHPLLYPSSRRPRYNLGRTPDINRAAYKRPGRSQLPRSVSSLDRINTSPLRGPHHLLGPWSTKR